LCSCELITHSLPTFRQALSWSFRLHGTTLASRLGARKTTAGKQITPLLQTQFGPDSKGAFPISPGDTRRKPERDQG